MLQIVYQMCVFKVCVSNTRALVVIDLEAILSSEGVSVKDCEE